LPAIQFVAPCLKTSVLEVVMADIPEDALIWNPLIFKDPWVELSALEPDTPDQQRQVVSVALQLQRDILAAQLKAVDALQAIAAKSGNP
jgi:hypothetical protein